MLSDKEICDVYLEYDKHTQLLSGADGLEKVYLIRMKDFKRNQEDVRQLQVNELVWIVNENVKQADYRLRRVLELYHGNVG